MKTIIEYFFQIYLELFLLMCVTFLFFDIFTKFDIRIINFNNFFVFIYMCIFVHIYSRNRRIFSFF